MSRAIKVGSRVVFKNDEKSLGINKGAYATVKEVNYDNVKGLTFANTDKLNDFNHDNYNGNGILCYDTDFELLIQGGRWTKDEIDYLHSQYRRLSITEIADKLKRSYYAIQSKARDEGIHKHPRREYNNTDNHFIIHSHIDNMDIDTIGANLQRSRSSINGRFALMNTRGLIPTIKSEA